MTKSKKGGARPGAGRPKGEPKKMIWFSVPVDKAEMIKERAGKYILKLLKSSK